MDTKLHIEVILTVSNEELSIIGRALCGRLKEREQAAAFELNRKLLAAKARHHEEQMLATIKVMESLEGTPGGDEQSPEGSL